MKKETFLKRLRKKLDILDEIEVNDIIQEYEGYIDEKMESGASEEEAVSSFGNIDELANELLKAYKIKAHDDDPIGTFASKVMHIIDSLVTDISRKSPREILKFCIEIILLIVIISLFHIPVTMLVQLGKEVFYILSSPLNRIFFTIWRFVLEFAYFILAIIAFVKIFDRRYLQNVKEEVMEEKKVVTKERKERKKEDVKVVPSESKHIVSGIGELIIKIGVFFLKFIAICILFGISMYLIGMTFVLVFCVYLLVQGVTYFGFYLVMISLFVLGVIFFGLLFNFVLDRKNNGLKLLISLFVSFILLGVGCGVATIEITDTEFINAPPEGFSTEVLKEELSMNSNTVFIGNVADYQIDNSLENVIIEYRYYPIGNKMATSIRKKGDNVYLDWSFDTLYFHSDLTHRIIKDLSNKKVYNYYLEPTITITASEKNIQIIKENRQKFYKKKPSYSSCDFVRTYYVEMIKDTHDDKYISIVLSEYSDDDLVTVRLEKSLANNLEVGASYEFTFKTYQAYIDTDIEDIFDENEVISIKKTDKVGLEQHQDTACSIFY